MSDLHKSGQGNLIAKVTGGEEFSLMGDGESMWLDVIHKMDEVYSDLLRYESDLEWKNKELEEAQTFISSVIASVSDILVVVDGRGIIQQVNPAFLKLLKQRELSLLGESIAEIIADEDRPLAMSLLIQNNRLEDCHAEFRFIIAGGISDVMAVNCSARLDHLGRRVRNGSDRQTHRRIAAGLPSPAQGAPGIAAGPAQTGGTGKDGESGSTGGRGRS